MAINAKHNDTVFGVGDRVKVTQKIKEGDKIRSQIFDGIVIGIRGEGENKSFTVRRIGVQQIGIERIFPLLSPMIEKIEVVREGKKGIKRAKLYYIRDKSKKEVERIYSRVSKKGTTLSKKKVTGSKKAKKAVKKSKTSFTKKNARHKKKK
jgi:large subunit ribosomal protein L19